MLRTQLSITDVKHMMIILKRFLFSMCFLLATSVLISACGKKEPEGFENVGKMSDATFNIHPQTSNKPQLAETADIERAKRLVATNGERKNIFECSVTSATGSNGTPASVPEIELKLVENNLISVDATSLDNAMEIVTSAYSNWAVGPCKTPSIKAIGDAGVAKEGYKLMDGKRPLGMLYASLQGASAQYELLASNFSTDYQKQSDVFKKAEILKALIPEYDKELASAREKTDISIQIPYVVIGHYDMSTKSFPIAELPLSKNSVISYDTRSALKLDTESRFNIFTPKNENEAREIEEKVNKAEGKITATLYAKAYGTWGNRGVRAVAAKTVFVEFKGPDGNLILTSKY